jgi:muconate cycloisomerase
MKISSVNVYKITLPFQFTFSHSQKDARSVDNIVVEILTHSQGLRGYGEGGPRPYVTGETQDTAVRDIELLCLDDHFPRDLHHVEQIWAFIESATSDKSHNAALCALEVALLDLLGKKESRNVLHYLPMDYATDNIHYGATIPIADHDIILSMFRRMKELDMADVRLKMGRDFQWNRRALEILRQVLGLDCDVRVDVNGDWDLTLAKQHLTLLDAHGVRLLEQPLRPLDRGWEDLLALAKPHNLKFMADESVCSLEDMENAISKGYFDVINVRLSKCGGFFNSLRIIRRIRDAGLNYQVGCQLGESGILSAAGRALSAVSCDALYYDGSYDAFLLKANLTTEHVTFSHAGRAVPLQGPGLGITVEPKNLDRFSNSILTVSLP